MAVFQILSTLTFTSYPTIRHIPVTHAASVVKQSTNNGDVQAVCQSLQRIQTTNITSVHINHTPQKTIPPARCPYLRLRRALYILPRQGNKT